MQTLQAHLEGQYGSDVATTLTTKGSDSSVWSWAVMYLRLKQSASAVAAADHKLGGWQKHNSPHIALFEQQIDNNDTSGNYRRFFCVRESITNRVQERIELGSNGALQDVAYVAAADGRSIIRFAVDGQPVRKFALIAESGRNAAELCQAFQSRGVNVRGMDDLPDALFLCGKDQRTVEALEADLPSLSRPEVQAYIVRLLFQDSFHQFVHDLSGMFSHVQTHLPLATPPPTTKTTATQHGPPSPSSVAAAHPEEITIPSPPHPSTDNHAISSTAPTPPSTNKPVAPRADVDVSGGREGEGIGCEDERSGGEWAGENDTMEVVDAHEAGGNGGSVGDARGVGTVDSGGGVGGKPAIGAGLAESAAPNPAAIRHGQEQHVKPRDETNIFLAGSRRADGRDGGARTLDDAAGSGSTGGSGEYRGGHSQGSGSRSNSVTRGATAGNRQRSQGAGPGGDHGNSREPAAESTCGSTGGNEVATRVHHSGVRRKKDGATGGGRGSGRGGRRGGRGRAVNVHPTATKGQKRLAPSDGGRGNDGEMSVAAVNGRGEQLSFLSPFSKRQKRSPSGTLPSRQDDQVAPRTPTGSSTTISGDNDDHPTPVQLLTGAIASSDAAGRRQNSDHVSGYSSLNGLAEEGEEEKRCSHNGMHEGDQVYVGRVPVSPHTPTVACGITAGKASGRRTGVDTGQNVSRKQAKPNGRGQKGARAASSAISASSAPSAAATHKAKRGGNGNGRSGKGKGEGTHHDKAKETGEKRKPRISACEPAMTPQQKHALAAASGAFATEGTVAGNKKCNSDVTLAEGGGRKRKENSEWRSGMLVVSRATRALSGRTAGLSQSLEKMWSEVNKHPSAWAFRVGVDPNLVPDYLDVVKHPIDLASMKKRLDHERHYCSKSMLRDDLVLMCRNAMLYNAEHTGYHSAARDLLSFIESTEFANL